MYAKQRQKKRVKFHLLFPLLCPHGRHPLTELSMLGVPRIPVLGRLFSRGEKLKHAIQGLIADRILFKQDFMAALMHNFQQGV